MIKKVVMAASAAVLLCGASLSSPALADVKIGLVNPQRVLSESAPAVAAQKKLQTYFKAREDALNNKIKDFRAKVGKFEKESPTMSESARIKRRQELGETERDIARTQRALFEERTQRAAEESRQILTKANRIIENLAKTGGYDLILQDAVYVNPRIDLTNEVIRQLNESKK